MYALICLFTLAGLFWMGFIYRVLVNLRRDQEIKGNNQAYHNFKLEQLYGKVQETEEGKESKEAVEEERLAKRPRQSNT